MYRLGCVDAPLSCGTAMSFGRSAIGFWQPLFATGWWKLAPHGAGAAAPLPRPRGIAKVLRMAKSNATASPEAPASTVATFERSLGELEAIVARLEGGELGLDESLAAFERGIRLFRECQAVLDSAEQRVKLLADPSDPDNAKAFAPATN